MDCRMLMLHSTCQMGHLEVNIAIKTIKTVSFTSTPTETKTVWMAELKLRKGRVEGTCIKVSHHRGKIIIIQPEGFPSRFLIYIPPSLLYLFLNSLLWSLIFQLCLHIALLGSSRTECGCEWWRRQGLCHICDRGVRDSLISIIHQSLAQSYTHGEGGGFAGRGLRLCLHCNNAAKIQWQN